MDSLKASETLEKILGKLNENPTCTLLDGNWGIGKTYLVNELSNQESDYELICISQAKFEPFVN